MSERPSLADQLKAMLGNDPATRAAKPRSAANDNKPQRKETRYRGTLPALKWLYENHPELAEPVAEAVQALVAGTWDAEVADDYLEFRPTIGEIVRAASDGKDQDGLPNWLKPAIESDKDGNPYVAVGDLKFVRGELVEYGKTRKGSRLAPRDAARPRAEDASATRDARLYVFRTKPTTPSPLHAEPYSRPLSDEPALAPMYDPQRGVEVGRAVLRTHGVDGRVRFEDLPFQATKCPPAIAKGAEFLGGVVQMSGNSGSGAIGMGELPEAPKGDVLKIIEDIAAGATLKDVGERAGYSGKYAIEVGKSAIAEAAATLRAANDNKRAKNRKSA